MSDRIDGYADAMLAIAQAEGDVQGISDELFAVGRAVDTNDDLRNAISDARMPAERKIQIMDDLLDGKARAATCLLYTSPSPRDATLSRMPSSA